MRSEQIWNKHEFSKLAFSPGTSLHSTRLTRVHLLSLAQARVTGRVTASRDDFIVNLPSKSTARVLDTSLHSTRLTRVHLLSLAQARVTGRVTASKDDFIVNTPSKSTTRILGMSSPVNSPSKRTTRLSRQM
ncbi:hypothetical protein F2Q69_00050742 [Brassica cretica]|uniref:Uncharacterized protein n=1 Tax=Brassica cretica TaxID=69181 RepID=A0A8S9PML2_BRACR|nr:hypothetical protein F2Q69_00050742 [Brassica cretica]